MELTVTRVERRRSSPSGNPQWWIHFEGRPEPLSTCRDAMLGYAVSGGWVGRTFEVTMVPGSVVLVEDMREVV